MRDMKRQTRLAALFLLGVVCLWQGGALVHLITVSHAICPHGKIVDGRHLHGGHGDNTNSPKGAPSPGSSDRYPYHDNCRLLSSLTSANTVPDVAGPVIHFLQACVLEPVASFAADVFHSRALYLTAPCHSPPNRA